MNRLQKTVRGPRQRRRDVYVIPPRTWFIHDPILTEDGECHDAWVTGLNVLRRAGTIGSGPK